MTDLEIGKDCSYESVCNAFRNSRAYKLPLDQWIRVTNLLVSNQLSDKLADKIELGVCSIHNAYRVVLQEWRKVNEKGATVGSLVDVFDKCGLDDAADEIREIFGLPPKPLQSNLHKYESLLQTNHKLVKDHISTNIGGLACHTTLSDAILSKFLENGVITAEELESYLNAAVSERARIVRFYNILMKRPQNYNAVMLLLEEDQQVKALWILQRFYRQFHSISVYVHEKCTFL